MAEYTLSCQKESFKIRGVQGNCRQYVYQKRQRLRPLQKDTLRLGSQAAAVHVLFGRLSCLEPFAVEKAEREAAASSARPESGGKTAFFPQNDRPYGVRRKAFHTENALVGKPLANACGAGAIRDTIGTR